MAKFRSDPAYLSTMRKKDKKKRKLKLDTQYTDSRTKRKDAMYT